MKVTTRLFLLLAVGSLWFSKAASAWDVSYEGNVLPNASALGSLAWASVPPLGNLALTSSDGDLLHMVDTTTASPLYWREQTVLPAGMPVTIETRVRVLAADDPVGGGRYGVAFGAEVYGGAAIVTLWPDKVGVHAVDPEDFTYYPVDLTQFHTFRVAVDADPHPLYYHLWMDGQLILTGGVWGGGPPGVYFGAIGSATSTSDSYWDYVRYSKEFLPVPEPSALMAFAGGLGALGLPMLRGKRRR